MCELGLMDIVRNMIHSAKRRQTFDVHYDGTPLSFEEAINFTICSMYEVACTLEHNSMFELATTLRHIVDDASKSLSYVVNDDGSPRSLEQAIVFGTETLLFINSRLQEKE